MYSKETENLPYLYSEIQKCKSILQTTLESKKNIINNKKLMTWFSLAKFVFIFSVSAISTGKTYNLMYAVHNELMKLINEAYSNIKEEINKIPDRGINEKQTIMYKLNYESYSDCHYERTSIEGCEAWYENDIKQRLPLTFWNSDFLGDGDSCLFESINHPKPSCKEKFEKRCTEQIKYDSCIYGDYMPGRLGELYNQLNELQNESTWDFYSCSVFMITCLLSFAAVSFFAYKLKTTSELVKAEKKNPYSFKDEELNCVNKLTAKLGISFKSEETEELIRKLDEIAHKLYQKRKCRWTFLNSNFGLGLDHSITKIIFEEAGLMPRKDENLLSYLG